MVTATRVPAIIPILVSGGYTPSPNGTVNLELAYNSNAPATDPVKLDAWSGVAAISGMQVRVLFSTGDRLSTEESLQLLKRWEEYWESRRTMELTKVFYKLSTLQGGSRTYVEAYFTIRPTPNGANSLNGYVPAILPLFMEDGKKLEFTTDSVWLMPDGSKPPMQSQLLTPTIAETVGQIGRGIVDAVTLPFRAAGNAMGENNPFKMSTTTKILIGLALLVVGLFFTQRLLGSVR